MLNWLHPSLTLPLVELLQAPPLPKLGQALPSPQWNGRVKDVGFPAVASPYVPLPAFALATFESIWAGVVEAGLFCPIGRGGGA